MSVINKMLRELDQRHAMSAPMETAASKDVRAVPAPGQRREWLWRALAVLMLVAVGWMGWVFYQIQPRQIATDAALAAAVRLAPVSVPAPAPATPALVAEATDPKTLEEPKEDKVEPLPDTLKLAQTIDTPIVERTSAEEAPPKAPPQVKALPVAKKETASPAAISGKVEKREIAPTGAQRAEAEFRRGTNLLQQGRVSEAEEHLKNAIAQQPGHESARQMMAALLIEQRRLAEARQILQEGLALNPGQGQFATALARILVERGEYPAALDVLNASRAAGKTSPDFDALLGSVLQRMGRYRDAYESYQQALRMAPKNGSAWVGLAISLESLERPAEAAEAYGRALASGTLAGDVQAYAEQKARQLR